MSIQSNLKENQKYLAPGTSIGSLLLIIVFMFGDSSGLTDSADAESMINLENKVDTHIQAEAHPIATEKLTQISKDIEDIEKAQKKLYDEFMELKIIICSNQDFNCILNFNN